MSRTTKHDSTWLTKFLKGESVYVLLDQAVVSGGNFATALVLARTLQPTYYGKFSLLLLFLYAINTCHGSLVVYPLTLQVATIRNKELERATCSSLVQTALLSVALAVICLLFVIATRQVSLILPLVGAMVAWQLQETTRRALLASQSAAKAVIPDFLCYVGQAAIILFLKPNSLALILGIIAGTSVAALCWQMLALGMRPWDLKTGGRLRSDMHFAWKMGRHILGGNAFNMVALQLPSWTLAWAIGPLGVAGYQSLLNLAGLANPIIFSVNTSLIPAVARIAPQGYPAARRVALRVGLQFSALLLPCFVALAVFPRLAMRTVYGASSPYLYLSGLLPIFIGSFAIQYVATVVGAYEGGMSRPETYFKVQSSSTVLLAIVAVVAIRLYGVPGAVAAMLLCSVFRLIASTAFSLHADRRSLASKTRTLTTDHAIKMDMPLQERQI